MSMTLSIRRLGQTRRIYPLTTFQYNSNQKREHRSLCKIRVLQHQRNHVPTLMLTIFHRYEVHWSIGTISVQRYALLLNMVVTDCMELYSALECRSTTFINIIDVTMLHVCAFEVIMMMTNLYSLEFLRLVSFINIRLSYSKRLVIRFIEIVVFD